ncbi:MAG TPA: hypothetical protein VGK59_18460 [Ohtaekwangia sp.]
MAKNLLIIKHSTQTKNSYWLENEYLERFIQVLIWFSNRPVHEIESAMKTATTSHEEITLEGPVMTSLKLNRLEYIELLKILRVVIAY